MTEINLQEVFRALKNVELPDCELVVGIAEGGIVPAALVASKIGRDLRIVRFNYRNQANLPQHSEPILLSAPTLPMNIKSILLVDDVAVSGKTLNAAKRLFNNHKVATMVFKGEADYVLLPKITTCVRWPWKL